MRMTDLDKTIGKFHLKVDEFHTEPGKIHGIVGPNGCGKTVFLKIAAGILAPDKGSIDYEGLTKQDITMLFQRPYLMQTTVYRNLIYPLQLRKQRPDEKEIDRLLLRAGLLEQKTQYARSLSSGERQKLSFLRALVFHPKLILVDETLSNLDAGSEEIFLGMIEEIQKECPVTWLVVNHQMDHIHKLCDKIYYMEKGRFVRDGIAEG